MPSQFVGVAGLPRAGSTLLCQLLAEHPHIHCDGHSSPLCNALVATRRSVSHDTFMLSQLDAQFDHSYANLKHAMQGFLHGWYASHGKPTVVDKNRAWLHCLELLLELDPRAKVLVPVRELGQIYGSIEAQHQKTILLDFIDNLGELDRLSRADQLFMKDKSIGAPLASIQAVQDLPQSVKDRLHFVKFEDLLRAPQDTMTAVFKWLELPDHRITPQHLAVRAHESDSHYRFKYRHAQKSSIEAPLVHAIPPRIQRLVEQACSWYYAWLYPDHVKRA